MALLTQADGTGVTTWSRSGTKTPSDIQYVMRAGNTVITIEFIGGNRVTDLATETHARPALSLVLRGCAGLLNN